MITAMEIRNYQFTKGVRGFKEEEVRNFLNALAQDYEKLYSENATLRDEIQRLEFELSRYRKIEDTMNNALILAQQTAEEVKNNARQEAALILEDSKKKISELMAVYQDVIKRLNIYSTEMKAHINGQMQILDNNQKKIDELSAFFYGKDIKVLLEKLEHVVTEEG